MNARASDIETEAIAWLVRVNSPQFEDWDKLTAWMALSGDHARIFNELAALDHVYAAASHASAEQRDALVQPAAPMARRRWPQSSPVARIAALAAVLLLAIFAFYPRTTAVQTRPGEMREVQLAGGVRVFLNGDTRIEYRGEAPRRVTLVRGEALFDVTHDGSSPFEVAAGKIVMRDLGTTFNVIRSASVTELAVAQGRVVFDSEGRALTLSQGEAARLTAQAGAAERFAVPADAVAGWRSGRLVYRNAALSQIAEDLSRRSGVPVVAGPDTAALRFTGTIAVGADLDATLVRIAPLLGVTARHGPSGWVLDAATP